MVDLDYADLGNIHNHEGDDFVLDFGTYSIKADLIKVSTRRGRRCDNRTATSETVRVGGDGQAGRLAGWLAGWLV